MAEKKQQELIFIPSGGVGHLFPTIEFTKAVAAQNEDLFITILIMKSPNHSIPIPDPPPDYPQIRFMELRQEENSSLAIRNNDGTFRFFFENIERYKSHAWTIVTEIAGSGRTHLAGIVSDMMCTTMVDVADELGVPSYVFVPTCASFLGLMFHMQALRDESGIDVTELKDSGKEFAVSTYIHPVPDTVLPSLFFEKGGGCDVFLDQAKRYRETKGILINTFTELEAHAVQSLVDDELIPPVYPIGPRLTLNGISDNRSEESDAIVQWLDLQPESSVLFLCFGSMGSFPVNQVKEIAAALETTGFRFLWSLRNPGLKIGFSDQALPEGFLERTAEVGKVIGWAPQAAVLAHPAVGGFVTHCGWNSILESVGNGVPMAAWPIYSEQQVNAFLLVKDLDLAAEIKMDYRKENEDVDFVSCGVIESGIRKLMDSGNGMRKRMKEMKEKSRVAICEGGSSNSSLISFLNAVRVNAVSI